MHLELIRTTTMGNQSLRTRSATIPWPSLICSTCHDAPSNLSHVRNAVVQHKIKSRSFGGTVVMLRRAVGASMRECVTQPHSESGECKHVPRRCGRSGYWSSLLSVSWLLQATQRPQTTWICQDLRTDPLVAEALPGRSTGHPSVVPWASLSHKCAIRRKSTSS